MTTTGKTTAMVMTMVMTTLITPTPGRTTDDDASHR